MEGGYHPPLLRLVRPLWYVPPRLGPPGQEGHKEIREGPEEATKVIRCLENMTNKETLGKLGLFHILKRTLEENPTVAQTTASKDDEANYPL